MSLSYQRNRDYRTVFEDALIFDRSDNIYKNVLALSYNKLKVYFPKLCDFSIQIDVYVDVNEKMMLINKYSSKIICKASPAISNYESIQGEVLNDFLIVKRIFTLSNPGLHSAREKEEFRMIGFLNRIYNDFFLEKEEMPDDTDSDI